MFKIFAVYNMDIFISIQVLLVNKSKKSQSLKVLKNFMQSKNGAIKKFENVAIKM